MGTTTKTAATTKRKDIQGLRTIAILAVVLVHAGVAWLPGGFVGVDVFFVISGFLIIAHLVREIERNGRIDLLAFWARRLRRLFPALAVVIVATFGVGLIVFSPLELDDLAMQGGASLVALANMLFAREATDYFGHEVQQSPFLHMWSLGVEEQFYITIPVFVVLLGLLVRRAGVRLRTVVMVAMLGVFALSFGASVLLSSSSPFWAFYTLPTRAWEFAVGGTLALVPSVTKLPSWSRQVASWAGLVMLVTSCVVITAGQVFPGYIALLPVLGTAMLIAGGTAASPVTRLLSAGPMQWIGDRSYSWYLWHWPAIIFTAAATGIDSPWLGLGAAALALILAHYTYLKVENPIRDGALKKQPAKNTYATMAGVLAAAALVGALVYGTGLESARSAENRLWAAAADQGAPASCPEKLTTQTGEAYCAAGNNNASLTVMIVGDSHAAQWVPTLAKVATNESFRLIIRTLDACPAANAPVLSHTRVNTACQAFQKGTTKVIDDLQPDIVLTANSNSYLGQVVNDKGRVPSASEQAAIWRDGVTSLVRHAQATGAIVASIQDTPRPSGDAAVCVTRPKGSVEECSPTPAEALEDITVLRDAERSALQSVGVNHTLSFDQELCSDDRCLIEDQGIPVFTDQSHVSQAWAETQADKLRVFIQQVK